MAKLILCVFVVSLIGATLAQDFEPPLLEGPITTTLEPPTTATDPPATETPTTQTPTTQIPAETTDAPSTSTPKTTTIATTTTTVAVTEPVTDSPFPTTQKTTTTPKPTTTSSTTTIRWPTTRKPATWYPNKPSFNKTLCYYKSQQGFPQMRWNCGRFEFVTPIECFHCCLYSNSYFAGCYRVNKNFCQTNNIRDDNDFTYFK